MVEPWPCNIGCVAFMSSAKEGSHGAWDL